MKKYYLVAEKKIDSPGYSVFVHDNPSGRVVLMEIEAQDYVEASRMFSFSARGRGRAAYCGVDANGEPFSGRA